MPTYKYTARDQEGKNVVGRISAENESAIVAELRKRNLMILSVAEEKESAFKKNVSKPRGGKRIKPEDLVIFTRQFATMVDAGIPILQSLEALSEQTANPTFKAALVTIREDIQTGGSLSGSFAKHPKIFDQLYVNMIRVGESGGILTTILERVAIYLEKSERLRQKVKGAMIYPAVVVSMAMLITVGLLVKVVPTFSQIYASLGQKLPVMTQMLIDFSNLLQHDLPFLIAGGFVAVFLFNKYKKTPAGHIQVDTMLLKMPVFGDLICKVSVSRFCRTFATLSQSGVPILESLDIVGKTCGNRVIEILVDEIKVSVKEGNSIAEPLSKSSIFPLMVTRMISVGEKSGQLEKMLSKVAEFYDEQVDTAVEGLTKLIEPLIIGFLGIVVGFIVVALFMPILSMTSAIK
ncbi:MAG: type II secretion system F family protein [Candidatus Omnitrophica bacterium]|nr:type II secretion system F family protein [Candidatus Omnitrophota bacterium]